MGKEILFSAIDIGSNAGRLLFSNVFEHEDKVVFEKSSLVRVPLRLGIDAIEYGKITDERVENLVNTMIAFKYLLNVYKPISFKACATAAMREASNKDEVVELIEKKVGIKLEIIDGLMEAKIVCASHNLDSESKNKHFLYVDVGGGSAELSVLINNKIIESTSFKIGTLRMLNNKIDENEWEKFMNFLSEINQKYKNITCVGSGGNINKLSKLYGKKGSTQLSYNMLRSGYNQLNSLTLEERIENMGLRPDRADVIIPAAKLFLVILKNINSDKILIPRIGLSDGLVHEAYYEYKAGAKEK